ncbi:MAG: aldose 1-epimerase [Caulobacteraceae bacterium]
MDLPIVLAAGAWRTEIAPDLGGSITALTRAEEPVLRARPSPRGADEAACHPLVPYANRIAGARFSFAGVAHRLAPTPPEAHALHGVGWRRSWRTVSASPRRCEIALEHRPDGAAAAEWPFGFDARQLFELDDDGLTASLRVENVGRCDAPAGIGLHAFFPRRPGERLAFASAGAWMNGPDLIPAHPTAGDAWDFAAGRALGETDIDNDFVGWRGVFRLWAPGGGETVVRADPVFGVLRCYAPRGRDFLAVEPVSHRANAINAPGEADAMTRLAPGETLAGSVRFERAGDG